MFLKIHRFHLIPLSGKNPICLDWEVLSFQSYVLHTLRMNMRLGHLPHVHMAGTQSIHKATFH